MGQLQRSDMYNGNARKQRRRQTEQVSEAIMTDSFPKLKLDTKPEIQEVQRMPSRINAPKPHIRTKKNS